MKKRTFYPHSINNNIIIIAHNISYEELYFFSESNKRYTIGVYCKDGFIIKFEYE